jgi:hypothetical protein
LVVPGLVLLRLRSEQYPLKWVRLKAAVQQFGDRPFGRYVVIEEARFRSRPLLKANPRGPPIDLLRRIDAAKALAES